jgi:hypothetical protein
MKIYNNVVNSKLGEVFGYIANKRFAQDRNSGFGPVFC